MSQSPNQPTNQPTNLTHWATGAPNYSLSCLATELPYETNGLIKLLGLNNYSRLLLSRNRRDPLKHFAISVLRHIRFVVLRKKQFEQPNFTNYYVIWLLYLEIYIKNIVKKGRNCSPGAISLLFHNIFLDLDLDFCVKTRTRFSLRDNRSRDNESWL